MIHFARRIALTRLLLLFFAQSIALTGACSAAVYASRPGAIDTRFYASLLMLAAGLVLFWPAIRTTRPLTFQFAYWRWLGVGGVGIAVWAIVYLGGRDDARSWFLALSASWAALLSTLLSRLPDAAGRGPLLRLVDLAVTNAAATIVLAELSLRAYGACTGQHVLFNQQLEAYRLQPNRNYGDLLHTNSQGYTSREFVREKRPGVRRVAALGDSFAVGVVRQERNYLHLLEQLVPGAEVYNFGVVGTGPREYDQILRDEVWAFDPDLVIVSIFVGNDVLGWWRLPSTDRLHPHAYRLYVLAERLRQMERERRRRAAEGERPVLGNQPLDFRPLSRARHLEHEAARLDICRLSLTERSTRAWNRTFLWLESTVAQCRERGVPLAAVLIPDEFQIDSRLLAETLEFRNVPAEDVDLTLPQRRLTRFYADRGVACLDLMPHFHGVPDAYKPRDTHWNEKGNRLAAEVIAAWIRKEGLLRPLRP